MNLNRAILIRSVVGGVAVITTTPEDPGIDFYTKKTSHVSETTALTLQVYTCSFRRVFLRTCGVQFTSRGTGRSAEQSGASAGCCGCRNMTVVKNLKHILGKWPSHRPPHDHYNLNGNMLKRSGLEWSSSLLVWLSSMVKMTFRKFVYRFPPPTSS